MYDSVLRSGNKIPTGGNMETKCGVETEGKGHPEIAPPGDLSHIHQLNQDAIGEDGKCLLMET